MEDKSRKSKKRHLLIAGSVLAVIGALYLTFRPKTTSVETVKATRGPFVEEVKSEGRLRSRERYVVTAFANGDITRVEVKAGDVVKKGQALSILHWDFDRAVAAPIDGVVTKVMRETAGPIVRGEPILEIVNPDDLEVVIELLTADAVRVPVGAEVRIDDWGGPEPLKAKVQKVSKAGFTKTSALGVDEERTEVIADLQGAPPEIMHKLGHNFHVLATIALSRLDNALTIPIGALFREGSQWAVYRVVDGKAKLTQVEVSTRGYQTVVITSGLNEGDVVVMYPGDQLKDGVRVSAH